MTASGGGDGRRVHRKVGNVGKIDAAPEPVEREPRHPIQPLVTTPDGMVRFKANAIVRYLLDAGPFDMNDLAVTPFDDADREQFAQLIGYSLRGFGELSYVSDETYDAAARTAPEPQEGS